MDKSWDELAAALDAIRPSESHSENAPSDNLPLKSLGEETFATMQDNQAPLSTSFEDLRAFLETEKDNFHPADVLLGIFPIFAIHYFPGTRTYRRTARAYEYFCGGTSKVRVDELDYTDVFDPVITVEEYADQLIDSVQKQGGRFLQLDLFNPGVNELDRATTHRVTLKYMERMNKVKSLFLSKRTRGIPNKFHNSVARYIPAKEFLNQSSSLRTKSLIVKKLRLAKAMLKSSEQRRRLVKIPSIKPSQNSTLSLGNKCPPFRHADDKE